MSSSETVVRLSVGFAHAPAAGENWLFGLPAADFVPDSVFARAELAAVCAPVRAVSNKVEH